MEVRTTGTQKQKATGYLNVNIEVKGKDRKEADTVDDAGNIVEGKTIEGTWYSFKGGIGLMAENAIQDGLMRNPEILEDSSRVRFTANVHIVPDMPDTVEF